MLRVTGFQIVVYVCTPLILEAAYFVVLERWTLAIVKAFCLALIVESIYRGNRSPQKYD